MSAVGTTHAESVITAFKALPTNEARRLTYQSLLAELTAAEWRDLQPRVNARTFQYDILGALPLELACHVCSYLDLLDIISSRRVSKRWKDLLALPITCEAAFASLYPERSLDARNPQWEAIFTQRAKRRHAIATGRPYSKATYISENWRPTHTEDGIVMHYCDGKLALNSTRDVTVSCLKTGETNRYTTDNREYLTHVQISENLVAAISTPSVCHVWDLHDGRAHSFRIPSLNIARFDIADPKVIIHMQTGSLLVWDKETQLTMETLLPEQSDAIFFNPSRNCLSIIHVEELSNEDGSPSSAEFKGVSLMEYSITESRMYRTTPCMPILCDYPIDSFLFSRRRASDPKIIMRQLIDPSVVPEPPLVQRQVLFDFSSGSTTPSVHTAWSPTMEFSSMTQMRQPLGEMVNMPGGVAYQAYIDPERPPHDENIDFIIQNPQASSRTRAEIGYIESELNPPPIFKGRVPPPSHIRPPPMPYVFGDEEFLCLVDPEEVTVYCFDEDFSTPGECTRYRTVRNQRAEERARVRRQRAKHVEMGTGKS